MLWIEPSQASLAQVVARQAGLRIVGLGVTTSARDSLNQIAESFGLSEIGSDWRETIAVPDAAAAVFFTSLSTAPSPSGERATPIDSAELHAQLRQRSIAGVSLEPCPASLAELGQLQAGDRRSAIPSGPLLAHARGFGDAAELSSSLGVARTLSIAYRCGPSQGSLGARLFDAMHLVHQLLGVPDVIDASVVTPGARPGLRIAPAEDLRFLRGDLTANLRYAGPLAASLSLSDRAGRWFRGATLISEGGSLRISETGLEHFDPTGRLLDDALEHPAPPSPQDDLLAAPGTAMAEFITRSLDPHAPKSPPVDHAAVLSMCEAAMLSARTGQPESPSMLQRIARTS